MTIGLITKLAKVADKLLVDAGVRTDLLAAEGTNQVKHTQPTGITFFLKKYLENGFWYARDYSELQQAIDYASTTGGGRPISLLQNTVYTGDSVILREGVTLQCDGGQPMSVQHLLAMQAKGLPILRCGAITDNFVRVPGDQFTTLIRNIVIDAAAQISGDALAHEDAPSGTAQRPGSRVENTLIFKRRNGRGWYIAPLHREGSFDNVFTRLGTGMTDPIDLSSAGEIGFQCDSVDWHGKRLWSAFARSRGLKYNGGGCRFEHFDIWGSQDVNAEIAGTSSFWERLQCDLAGNSNLLLNAAQNATFQVFVSLSHALTAPTPTDAVVVSGDARSNTFINPQMRGGPAANSQYAFGLDTASRAITIIKDAVVSTSYTGPFSPRMLTYGDIGGGVFANRTIRGNGAKPVELNTNPVFGNISGGIAVDWPNRNNGSQTQLTAAVDLPTDGLYATGLRVTSGSTGTSGVNFIVPTPEKYQGRIARFRAKTKGSGAAATNNQRLQIYDGVGGAFEAIPNDATWGETRVNYQIPLGTTLIQCRVLAANDTTPGLVLDVTDVSIDFI